MAGRGFKDRRFVNSSTDMGDVLRTIRHLIDRQARTLGDKIFLLTPERGLEITYSKLRDDSILMARSLIARGFRKGDKISFMMGNGYQTAKIFLGAMYAGMVVAPLNLKVQRSQLEYVLEHSDTRIVLVVESEKERLVDALKAVTRDIEVVDIDVDAEYAFPEKDAPDATLPDVCEDDPALLLYTSGTTGAPKGVVLTHKNMVAGGEYTALAHRISPEDRALCSLPLYHINGEIVTVIAPLVSGSSVLMPYRFSVSTFWEYMSKYRCTWFSVVPTIISYLVSGSEIEGKGLDLSRVRFGRSASSALPPELHREFEHKFGVSVIETMGLTETAAPVFSNPLDPKRRKYGSPGRAVGNAAKIIDKDGNEMLPGVTGEIMIKGDNVMKEYYKAPDITAKNLGPDGWLHTGDLGYMDEEGFVYVTGRIKELIIKCGENIAPREIDEALYRHLSVLEAAAVGVPDDVCGEEIVAVVALKPGCSCGEKELIEHCLSHLGEFKTPKTIRFLDELPKGPSGKIQRLKLRDLFE